ncbi:MAG: sugar kinase [Quisquiliibacterium sp.]
MRFDLLAIGEPMVEFNQPREGDPNYLQGFGGDTSNAIIAAARAGARCAYFTRLGDDEFGRQFKQIWTSEGVECGTVMIDPSAHTAVYFVTHGPQGHVFSYLRAGSAASRICPDDLPREQIAQADILYASGISMAISATACDATLEALRLARAAGGKTAFDSNLRLKLWPLQRARRMISAAVALSDYFMPSLEDLTALTGIHDEQALVDWCHLQGARTVLLKMGPAGVLVSDGARREQIAGHRVKALDATGAGDCFCGNFLARIAAGDSIWQAARYANAAAALSTTGLGAVAPLPAPEQVRRLLG